VTAGIATSIDPRYATGLCLHGKTEHDAVAERVALVHGKEAAERVIDQRTEARTVKRALRKSLTGQDLSANEQAALDRRAKART